jgi:hypothetical protein
LGSTNARRRRCGAPSPERPRQPGLAAQPPQPASTPRRSTKRAAPRPPSPSADCAADRPRRPRAYFLTTFLFRLALSAAPALKRAFFDA